MEASNSLLVKLQAASGSIFGIYAIMHLLNHASAHLGVETFTEIRHLLRLVYQSTLIETLIFFSLGVHLTVNTILISRRWKREKDPKAQKSLTLAQKMHRWSGYFLGAVIVGHILATRYQQNFFGPEYQADFAFTTYGLKYYASIFYPYYFLLGVLGLYHLTYGMLRASDLFLHTRIHRAFTESKNFSLYMAAGAAILLSSLMAYHGYYFNVNSPRVEFWRAHFAKFGF
jgi:hypothetical protein